MELFKNKVGRPSNETISKRRKIYAIIFIAASCLICFIVVFLVNQLNPEVSSKPKNAMGTTRTAYFVSGSRRIPVSCTSITKSCKVTVPNLTVDKLYKFLGWAKKENAAKAELFAGNKITLTAKETTYYAVVQYTINVDFYSNYATNSINKLIKSVSCTKTTSSKIKPCVFNIPSIKVKSGFELNGWDTSSNENWYVDYGSKTKTVSFSYSTKLYAITKSKQQYTLYMYSNDGRQIYGDASCYRFNGASSCKVSTKNRGYAGVNYINKMERNGMVFKGWAATTNVKYTQTSKYILGHDITISGNVKKFAVFK